MPRRRPGKGGASFADPKLLPRVNGYIAGRDKKTRRYIDSDEVVEYLRGTFPEYTRKPINVLKSTVERSKLEY